MPATNMPDELREAREWRLKEEHDRQYHPIRTKIENADRFARNTIRVAPFVALAVFLVVSSGASWLSLVLAAVLIFERRAISSGLARGLMGAWKLASHTREQRAKHAADAQRINRIDAAAERLQPAADDTFAGKSIVELAQKIAASGQPVITKESLAAALQIPTRKADDLRQILLNSQFLLYPITTDLANARPIGSEKIAFKDERAKRATTIHPTLMNAPAAQRALVIANAIRRTMQFSVGEEPRVMGEPSAACTYTLGVTGSHLAESTTDTRRVPVHA